MTKIATTKRNSSFLNKNSAYVQSLVSFILDTKPYHCKLTETVEEYQFSDEMLVKIEERLHWQAKVDGVWKYDYFSSANTNLRSTHLTRTLSPLFTQDQYLVGVDEVKDLASVPYVYSKKSYDGASISAVKFARADGSIDPLTEGVDWFESLGSFEFQVKQIKDASGRLNPLWQSTADEKLMLTAIQTLRESALDVTNPKSNVNQIRVLMNDVQKKNRQNGNDPAINAELTLIFAILDRPWLPNSYNDLFIAIENNPVMKIVINVPALTAKLEHLSPRLFFGDYTDMNFREGGLLYYSPKVTPYLSIRAIIPDFYAPYEEWTILCVDALTQTFIVTGSVSGYAGKFVGGLGFGYPGHISFSTTRIANAPQGWSTSIRPSNRMAVHPSALMETWNLIQTNPQAYTRPYLTSAQYGAIYSAANVRGEVTLISPNTPTSTFVIKCVTPTTFVITNSKIPGYKKNYTVGTLFTDAYISFRIRAGTLPFIVGDKFYIGVENKPAQIDDLSMTFGYDMDAYDNDHLLYSTGLAIGFYYDTRYPEFDPTTMRMSIDEAAIDGRKWRMTAMPNKAKPVSTLKKDGSGPNANVDLQDATSGTPPDPASNAKPLYSMGGTHESDPDLTIYQADTFKLEFSDTGETWTFVQNISIDQTYVLAQHGLTFIVPSVQRPFIGVSSYEGAGKPRVEMGDIITFTVTNPHPTTVENPIGLTSPYTPRLEMQGSGFYWTPDAFWTVEFLTDTSYKVSAIHASGDRLGQSVVGLPLTCQLSLLNSGTREGHSFKIREAHFTIVPNRGLKKGDKFTFRTFEETPTFVVHGSVSGYTGVAEVGKYFWNGAIGFTLSKPSGFVRGGDGNEVDWASSVKIDRIRSDHPKEIYSFTQTPNGGWQVTSDIRGVMGYVGSRGTYETDQIRIQLLKADLTPLLGGTNRFRVVIETQVHELFNAPDVVIIKPPFDGLLPIDGETVFVTKTRDSHFNIAITPDKAPIIPLMPTSIDPRIIDLDTNSETPITVTSPELGVLRGFIPMTVKKRDSTTSPAEFYDPTVYFDYTSAATGEKIGTAKPYDLTRPGDTFQFEWDTGFFQKYLPINADAVFISSSPGYNEKVRVHISESMKMMIGADGIDEDFEFQDNINVTTEERLNWLLRNSYKETINVKVVDKFGKFVPGYDNVPYDGDEKYDAGQPPDIYSLLARWDLTDEVKNGILRRWNFYLINGDQIPSTKAQWDYLYKMMQTTDPNPGGLTDQFGIPYTGHGFDIDEAPDTAVGANIEDTAQIKIAEHGSGYGEYGYDSRPFDTLGNESLNFYPTRLPPYQNSTFTPGMDWNAFRCELETLVPARQFEINYPSAPPVNMVYRVWVEGNSGLQLVPVVERTSPTQVVIYLANPAKVKITVTRS